ISQRYQTTVDQLKKWNNLSSDIIYPNQMLQVNGRTRSNTKSNNNKSSSSGSQSNSNQGANTYTDDRGDTLSGIAAKYRTRVKNLMEWNNLNTTLIHPGDKLYEKAPSNNTNNKSNNTNNTNNSSNNAPSTSTNAATYVVKSGDTLSHIAKAHGVS